MSKIGTLDDILQRLSSNRKEGAIVVASGCFDIFHIGHLDYLEGARRLGRKLIVGVNSDLSVSRIKEKKPLFTEGERSRIVAALDCVDDVFIFGEDTMERNLLLIRPDIFAKGVDRQGMRLPEQAVCERIGTSIIFIGNDKRASSSSIKKGRRA